MFELITESNIPWAYRQLTYTFTGRDFITANSRNGKVRTLTRPVCMAIARPQERVLFDKTRNANPIFHLMEALWMLAGNNDVAFPARFNGNIGTYSDDKEVFNAAYGYRWRHHFGYDQVERAIEMLKANPVDRRIVISMWDPYSDFGSNSLDIPCNQQMMPRIVDGRLDMLTTNRSNDLIWGLMGANCVHLTILQEFMAAAIGVKMGFWRHVTNNLHVYERHWPLLGKVDRHAPAPLPGPYPGFQPLVKDWRVFRAECQLLCEGQDDDFTEPFFDGTVAPMVQSWEWYKRGDMERALYDARCIDAPDWRKATVEWYTRRIK
jgi:thymidylate synthase